MPRVVERVLTNATLEPVKVNVTLWPAWPVARTWPPDAPAKLNLRKRPL